MSVRKCLTIRQPWAWAVFAPSRKRKDVENKSLQTKHRGLLLIHAGANRLSTHGHDAFTEFSNGLAVPDPDTLDFGAIIGVVQLTDVVPYDRRLANNSGASGDYCWLFEDARTFSKPIPWKGQLGLWGIDLSDPAATAVRKQLAAVGIKV